MVTQTAVGLVTSSAVLRHHAARDLVVVAEGVQARPDAVPVAAAVTIERAALLVVIAQRVPGDLVRERGPGGDPPGGAGPITRGDGPAGRYLSLEF